MPLYLLERAIRETCEDDTGLEIRLDGLAETALRLREQIVADGRIDGQDLPALVTLLGLVPDLREGCRRSLAFNRQVNALFGRLASERRTAERWAAPEGERERAA